VTPVAPAVVVEEVRDRQPSLAALASREVERELAIGQTAIQREPCTD